MAPKCHGLTLPEESFVLMLRRNFRWQCTKEEGRYGEDTIARCLFHPSQEREVIIGAALSRLAEYRQIMPVLLD